jgi:uncharacterized protein (TIGR03905 family)
METKPYKYIPDQQVCAHEILIRTDGETIEDVQITGGCAGNSEGLRRVLRGMRVSEAIARMEGIPCGRKTTSCPDQVARALKELVSSNGE